MTSTPPAVDLPTAPCSDQSRARLDSMVATAAPVDRWLLVEIAGPWGRNAFTQSHLDPRLGEAILRRAAQHQLRAVAIRRPGRHAEQTSWRWAYADSRPGHEQLKWGVVEKPGALLDVPLDAEPARSGSSETAYLVCTHAKHDRCCAVRGRPVADRLAQHRPSQTWEVSHLGGDRFAGTMVMLPFGHYFGRVDDDNVVSIVESYERGELADRFLRGRSSLSAPAQAAQHAARAASGDFGLTAFPPLHVEQTAVGRWAVLLGAAEATVAIEVEAVESAPLHATCLSQRLARVPVYKARILRASKP